MFNGRKKPCASGTVTVNLELASAVAFCLVSLCTVGVWGGGGSGVVEHRGSDLAHPWQPGVHFTNNRAETSPLCRPAPSSHHKLEKKTRSPVTASLPSLTCKCSFYLRHPFVLLIKDASCLKRGWMKRRTGLWMGERRGEAARWKGFLFNSRIRFWLAISQQAGLWLCYLHALSLSVLGEHNLSCPTEGKKTRFYWVISGQSPQIKTKSNMWLQPLKEHICSLETWNIFFLARL